MYGFPCQSNRLFFALCCCLQSGGSSTENLAKDDRILHQRVHFKLFYIGCLSDISGLNSKRRDTEAQLIDYVEEKQVWCINCNAHLFCTVGICMLTIHTQLYKLYFILIKGSEICVTAWLISHVKHSPTKKHT